jgi:diacylglycerol kinase
MKNRHLLDAAKTSTHGLAVLAREKAFWRELMLVVVALLCLWLAPNGWAVAALIISVAIIALEALNTAIEGLCNLVQPELDHRIRDIKDVAAASILVMVMLYFLMLLLWVLA